MADDDFVDEYAFDLKIDAKKTMQWQSKVISSNPIDRQKELTVRPQPFLFKIRDAHKEEFDMSDSEDGGAGDESDGAEDFDLSDDGSQVHLGVQNQNPECVLKHCFDISIYVGC